MTSYVPTVGIGQQPEDTKIQVPVPISSGPVEVRRSATPRQETVISPYENGPKKRRTWKSDRRTDYPIWSPTHVQTPKRHRFHISNQRTSKLSSSMWRLWWSFKRLWVRLFVLVFCILVLIFLLLNVESPVTTLIRSVMVSPLSHSIYDEVLEGAVWSFHNRQVLNLEAPSDDLKKFFNEEAPNDIKSMLVNKKYESLTDAVRSDPSNAWPVGIRKKKNSDHTQHWIFGLDGKQFLHPEDHGFQQVNRVELSQTISVYHKHLWSPQMLATRALPTGTWWSLWTQFPGTGPAHLIHAVPYVLEVVVKKKGLTTLVGDRSGLIIMGPLTQTVAGMGYEQARDEKSGLFLGVLLQDEFAHIVDHFISDWDEALMIEKSWIIASDIAGSSPSVKRLEARIIRGSPWITMRFPAGVSVIIDSIPRSLVAGVNTIFKSLSSLTYPPGLRVPSACSSISRDDPWIDEAVLIELDDGTEWAIVFARPIAFWCSSGPTSDRIETKSLESDLIVRVALLDQCDHIWKGSFFPNVDHEHHICPTEDSKTASRLRWGMISALRRYFLTAHPEHEGPVPWAEVIRDVRAAEDEGISSKSTFAPYFRKLPLKDELLYLKKLGLFNDNLPVVERAWTVYETQQEFGAVNHKADAVIIPQDFVSTEAEWQEVVDSGLQFRLREYVWQGGHLITLGGLGDHGFVGRLLRDIMGVSLFYTDSLTVMNSQGPIVRTAQQDTWGIYSTPPYSGQENVPEEVLPGAMAAVLNKPKEGLIGNRDSVQQIQVLYENYPLIGHCTRATTRNADGIARCTGTQTAVWYFGRGLISWLGRGWNEEPDLAWTPWTQMLARSIFGSVCSAVRLKEDSSCADLTRVVVFTSKSARIREENWTRLQDYGVIDGADNINVDLLQELLTGTNKKITKNVGKAVAYYPDRNIMSYKDFVLRHAMSIGLRSSVAIENFSEYTITGQENPSDWLGDQNSVLMNYEIYATSMPDAENHSLSPFIWDKFSARPMWSPERLGMLMTPLHVRLEYKLRSLFDDSNIHHIPLNFIRSDVMDEENICLPSSLGNVCGRSFGVEDRCLNTFDPLGCADFKYWKWDRDLNERRQYLQPVAKLEPLRKEELRSSSLRRFLASEEAIVDTFFMEGLVVSEDFKSEVLEELEQYPSLAKSPELGGEPPRASLNRNRKRLGGEDGRLKGNKFDGDDGRSISNEHRRYWTTLLALSPLRPGSVLHRVIDGLGYVVLTSEEIVHCRTSLEAAIHAKPIQQWTQLWERLETTDWAALVPSEYRDSPEFESQALKMFTLYRGLSQPVKSANEGVLTNMRSRLVTALTHMQDTEGDWLMDPRSNTLCHTGQKPIQKSALVNWQTDAASSAFALELFALSDIDWMAVVAVLSGSDGLYLAPRDSFTYKTNYAREGSPHRILLNLPVTAFDVDLLEREGKIFENMSTLPKLRPVMDQIHWGLYADVVSDRRLDPEPKHLLTADDFSDWLRVNFKYAQMALMAHISGNIIPGQQTARWLRSILGKFLSNDFENRLLYDATIGGIIPCGCDREANEDNCVPAPRLGYYDVTTPVAELAFTADDFTPWLAQACPSMSDVYHQGGLAYYQDHHKIWGYVIYIAAVLEYILPGTLNEEIRIQTPRFISTSSIHELVRTYILDFASPAFLGDYNCPLFSKVIHELYPTARHKDWYTFNSFSNGLNLSEGLGPYGRGPGEAVFAYWAVALYGRVRGDYHLQQWGRLLVSTEIYHANAYHAVKEYTNTYPTAIRYLGAIGTRADMGGYFLATKGVAAYQVMAELVQPYSLISLEGIEPGWALWATAIWEASCRSNIDDCIKSFADLPFELMRFIAGTKWGELIKYYEELAEIEYDELQRSGLSRFGNMIDIAGRLGLVEKVGADDEDVIEQLGMDKVARWISSVVANTHCFKIGSYDCGIHTLSGSLMMAAVSSVHGGSMKQLELEDGNGRFRVY